PALLVPAEKERSAAMRTVVLDQSQLSMRVSECNQSLAEQQDPHGIAVGRRQLTRQQRWDPVLAHEPAHDRSRTYATQQLVVFDAQHTCTFTPIARVPLRVTMAPLWGMPRSRVTSPWPSAARP